MQCMTWPGAVSGTGYGCKYVPGRGMVYAHRLAFEQAWNLSIPEGMVVMHTCDNKLCVNPLHLQLGTHGNNMRDMSRKGRARNGFKDATHCIRGHEFTEENTLLVKNGRTCRACNAERSRQYRERGKV